MKLDDPTRRHAEQDGIDEQKFKRRYYERLCDWSDEPMKINRDGRLLVPLPEARKRIVKLPWNPAKTLATGHSRSEAQNEGASYSPSASQVPPRRPSTPSGLCHWSTSAARPQHRTC